MQEEGAEGRFLPNGARPEKARCVAPGLLRCRARSRERRFSEGGRSGPPSRSRRTIAASSAPCSRQRSAMRSPPSLTRDDVVGRSHSCNGRAIRSRRLAASVRRRAERPRPERPAPGLAALYPPNALPDPERLQDGIAAAAAAHDAFLYDFLDRPPQTNEVGRSSSPLGGCLLAARDRKAPRAFRDRLQRRPRTSPSIATAMNSAVRAGATRPRP